MRLLSTRIRYGSSSHTIPRVPEHEKVRCGGGDCSDERLAACRTLTVFLDDADRLMTSSPGLPGPLRTMQVELKQHSNIRWIRLPRQDEQDEAKGRRE